MSNKNIRFRNVFIFLLLATMSIFTTVAFAGTPRTVVGAIRYADNTTPPNGSVGFTAYIKPRTGEVQTETSPGTNYYTNGVINPTFRKLWCNHMI